MGDWTPADRGYQLQVLVDRIGTLESRVARLEWAGRVVVSRATVTAAASGAMVNVVFSATSQIRAVPYLRGYTPAINDPGLVFDSGVSIVFVPVSAFV